MHNSFAPGQQATAGKEVPKGSGNSGPIPFDRKGDVKPSGKSWDAISRELGGSQGLRTGKPVNVS